MKKFLFALCLSIAGISNAQTLKIIVPYGPGGNTDLTARIFAKALADNHVNAVIINKPGADGLVGTNELINSRADGQTVMFTGNSAIVFNSTVNPVAHAAMNQIIPVMQASLYGQYLIARKDSEIKTFEQLRQAVKTRTVVIGTGHASVRSAIEDLFPDQPNLIILNLNGDNDTLSALANKSIEVATLTAVIEKRVQSGEFTGLAVMSRESRGNTKSLVAQGYNVYRDGWSGFFAPPGTPPEVIDRLHGILDRVRNNPEVQQQIDSMVNATIAPYRTPSQFKKLIDDEFAKTLADNLRRRHNQK